MNQSSSASACTPAPHLAVAAGVLGRGMPPLSTGLSGLLGLCGDWERTSSCWPPLPQLPIAAPG